MSTFPHQSMILFQNRQRVKSFEVCLVAIKHLAKKLLCKIDCGTAILKPQNLLERRRGYNKEKLKAGILAILHQNKGSPFHSSGKQFHSLSVLKEDHEPMGE